jgi:N-methylhydantoinase B
MTDDVAPATVEVVRKRLFTIAEEMQSRVMNAAYATLWQEAGDLSCGLLNRDAEIIGQSERIIPVHIASMMSTLEAAIEGTGGVDALEPGDVLINNDPYAGNNHLPDIMLARPVFADGLLLGFAAARAHWVDIGGANAGSYGTDTDSLVAEGLRIPPSKLYEAGEENADIVNMLLANVRNPDERRRDLNAQLAGVSHGHERFAELAGKYGAETTDAAVETALSNDETRMRNRIDALPDGRYAAEDHMDGVGGSEDLLTIRATVEVDGSAVDVDFDGTDDQVAEAINAPIAVTKAATGYALKCTLLPGGPGTLGAYRTITTTAPEGSLVNAAYPAPVVYANHETGNRIHDVVVQAVGEIDPGLIYAGGEGSANNLLYESRASGQFNLTRFFGGQGACPGRDGVNAKRSGVGNTGIEPMEWFEERYPFLTVESFGIARDTGGAGRYRGGNATRMVMRFDDETNVTLCQERVLTRPFAVDGGEPGTSAQLHHLTSDGERIPMWARETKTIDAGDGVALQPAGGGGYGDPTDRPPAAVLEDVKDGYVSVEKAESAYDVVIDEAELVVDEAATAERRG